MLRVKTIGALKISDLETKINSFLDDVGMTREAIVDIKYGHIWTEQYGYTYSALIIYEDSGHERENT